MIDIQPCSEEWDRMMQQALTEAAEKAIAMHIREGRGDQIRAMQEMAQRYYATHPSQA